MERFSKKQLVWAVAIIGVILGGYWLILQTKKESPQNTTIVKRSNLTQEVSVIGRVKPATTLDLSVEKSGRIQEVSARVGTRVSRGALLVEIESGSAYAILLEAEARLAELRRGSRPEEIAVKEAELAKYEQDLLNTYDGIIDTAIDSFSKADDALHTKTAGIFSGFKTTAYKFTYQICNSQLENDTTTLKSKTENDFDVWRTEIATAPNLSKADATQKVFLSQTGTHLEATKFLLENISSTLTLDCTVSLSTLDTYRTNINTARTNINTAIATVNTKKQSIASLERTIEKTRTELALLHAGTAQEVIAAQEARVIGAQRELNKYKIYAPISGIVTTVEARIGEYANASTPLVSIISDTSFEIEAYVPEADIAKIHVGEQAQITLDAYGNDVLFEGNVTAIDPAETIIENVPTYKVTFSFKKNDARIKSGMTANIDISTAHKDNILTIPQRAVISKNGTKVVLLVNEDSSTTETPIVTGLRGSNGTIEVTEGLKEGDVIIAAPK